MGLLMIVRRVDAGLVPAVPTCVSALVHHDLVVAETKKIYNYETCNNDIT